MAHPDFERWTTEETIVSVAPVPELAGTLVTKRTKVFGDTLTPGFLKANDMAKRELPESHLLLHQSCVYVLDGSDAMAAGCAQAGGACLRPNRDDLLRGNIAADYCFPIAKGMSWGKVPGTSPSEEYVWHAGGLDADPFGPPGGKTFHLSSYGGSGISMDRWFEQGVGLVQEVIEHHGTYDEDRRQLVRATIHGKTHAYQLTRARIVPSSEDDCDGPGWQHFARADGVSFRDKAGCVGYTSHGR